MNDQRPHQVPRLYIYLSHDLHQKQYISKSDLSHRLLSHCRYIYP